MALLSGQGLGGGLISAATVLGGGDADVDAFFAAFAPAETYSAAEKTMISDFVAELKAQSLWDLIDLLWVPIGDTINGVFRALKHPLGTGYLMGNNNFVLADWNKTVGLGLAGSTGKWIETDLTELDFVNNDNHLMIVSETAVHPGGIHMSMGSFGADRWQLAPTFSDGGVGYWITFPSNGTNGGPAPNIDGVFMGVSTPSYLRLFSDNTVMAEKFGSFGVATGNSSPLNIFRAGNVFYSRKTLSAASAGASMTDAQYTAYETALQNLRAARAAL